MNTLPEEIVILDGSGILLAVNDAWRDFARENGGSDDVYIGKNYFDICRRADGASSAEAPVILDGLQQVLATGRPFVCEYPCDSPAMKRWFELTATRMDDRSGTFLVLQHRNVTTQHNQREALRNAQLETNTLAALVTGTTDAILSYDLEGRVDTWNPAAEELYGYTREEIQGKSLEILYPEGWETPITHYRDEIIAGRMRRFEATRMAKDGTPRHVWISGAPIRDASGAVVAVSNIHRDISELQRAEKARELMAREVIHRAKNMLTIVSAVQRQTARSSRSIEDFTRSFGARIKALAASTDLLVGRDWSSVDVRSLVSDHIAPFTTEDDARVTLDGPDVLLAPQAVQTIGMALHELATNALKYGALKAGDGTIAVTWRITPGMPAATLDFEWREEQLAQRPGEGGSGFGSTVLTRLAPSMLETESTFRMEDDRVTWRISIDEAHFSVSH